MDKVTKQSIPQGEWTENTDYINFEITGILIPMDCTFSTLHEILEQQLQVSRDEERIQIKYKLREYLPPLKIENDFNLKFYLEVKSKEEDSIKFPLCKDLLVNLENQLLLKSKETSLHETAHQNAMEGTNSISEESSAMENMGQNLIDYIDYEQIQIGNVYNNKDELIKHINSFALKNQFQYKVNKSCNKQYHIKCLDQNCNWHLKASLRTMTTKFIIRKYDNNHTCPLDKRMNESRQATAKMVGHIIKSKYLNNIKTVYTTTDIIRDMKNEHGISLDYIKVWRSKDKALEIIRGRLDESYQKLPVYLYMLEKTNPGLITELVRKDDNIFLFLFMAINASINGWKHCRPVVVVDGTLLKASYGGTLLSACTHDGNGSIFPLAFAIVDSENDRSWVWFFIKFRQTFGLRESMCIVSDKHISIETTINEVQIIKYF
ncbi:hypothetical protein DH2020_005993 [Rehmannia glutinosa]|uniref:Uncharacterized protein n=1 Tax=Rehmannia glutinosa TaxID=99300 RepID=A0ABR0XHV1_REHGL